MKKLMPFILILLSIGIFFFLIDPLYKESQDLNEEIKINSDMLELAKRLDKQKEQLQEAYRNIGDQKRTDLEKVLPDSVDNVRLILDISNIAKEFGITIGGISINGGGISDTNESQEKPSGNSKLISQTSGGKKYGVITVGFSLSATYDVFKDFLRRLEQSLRLVDVRSFSVSAGGDGVFYNYSVTLDTYWLR